MFLQSDRLLGSARGSAAQAIAAAKAHGAKADFQGYINAVFELAPPIGLDPGMVVAQAIVETDWFTSMFWVRDGNPGGIGIDGDDSGNSVTNSPFKHLTGRQAAIVHLAALFLKIDGTGFILPTSLAEARSLAGTYLTHVITMTTDRNWPAVSKIMDLCLHFESAITGDQEATWAWDVTYADQICTRANALFPVIVAPGPKPAPEVLVFGNVKHPGFIDDLILDSENSSWNYLGPRQIKGVVLHRQVGYNAGTRVYFRQMANARATGIGGLTDYGIDRNTGVIYRWNDPLGLAHKGISPNRAAWASGPWMNPPGDGRPLVAKYGVNVINRDLISFEIDGMYADPVGPTGFEELAKLLAYWADQCKVPYSSFPINPFTGLSFVFWHSEFQSEKPCPADVVRGLTSRLIARAKEILRAAQVSTSMAPPPVVKPPVVKSKFPKLKVRIPGRVKPQTFMGYNLAVNAKSRFTCIGAMWARTGPSLDAPRIAFRFMRKKCRYSFEYITVIHGEKWLVSHTGFWLLASKFVN